MLALLLTNKIRMMSNNYLQGDSSKKWRQNFAFLGGAIIFSMIFNWAYDMFFVIHFTQSAGLIVATNMLALIGFGIFTFLFVSGISVAIHYLFTSSDLPILMTAPLSPTTILNYKLIEIIIANSTIFLFVGFPVTFAYGIVFHASWYYYPAMLIIICAFLTLPATLSFLIAIMIVRAMPAVRAREILAGVVGIVTLGIWIMLQMFRSSHFNIGSTEYNPERIAQLSALSQNLLFQRLPSTWAARSFSAFTNFNADLIVTQFFPLLLCTAIIFIISVRLAHGLFRAGLIGLPLEISIAKQKKATLIGENKSASKYLTHRSSIIAVIFFRDLKLLVRDLRQLTHVLILTAMMIIFPLVQHNQSIAVNENDFIPFMFIVMLSSIITSQISSRFISFEGKAFWMMMMAPRTWRHIIIGKFLVGFLLNLSAVWLATSVACLHFGVSQRTGILVFILSFFICAAISVYGSTIGCLFPKFDWEHPKRMLGTGGSLLAIWGSLLFVGSWLAILTIIYTLGTNSQDSFFYVDVLMIVISIFIAGLTAVIGLLLSIRKLSKLEWQF